MSGDRCPAGVAPDGAGVIWRCERPAEHVGFHRRALTVYVGGDPNEPGPVGAQLFWPDEFRHPVEALRAEQGAEQ